jgi:hypothetical protein
LTSTPGGAGQSQAPVPLLRAVSQWFAGAVLAVVLTALFLTINAMQLTSRGVGERLLGWHVAVTTNIDAVLPELEEELREEARGSEEETVVVPGFPIVVEMEREEALTLEGAALRQRILEDASRKLYEDGTSAWAEADAEGKQDIELVSTPGAIDAGMGLVSDETHTLSIIAAVVLAVLAVTLTVALLASVRGWGRFVAMGVVVVVAAVPSLAGAVALRFVFRSAQEEADPWVYGMLELGVEAMWVPIRNYLTLTLLGAATLLLTLALIWASGVWAARRSGAAPA